MPITPQLINKLTHEQKAIVTKTILDDRTDGQEGLKAILNPLIQSHASDGKVLQQTSLDHSSS